MVAEGAEVPIIYPPPEVRNIVDKTAGFVARNGIEFEQRIKQNEINNPKFNFLNPGDPYHAYYKHKVVVIREGKPDLEKPQLKAITTDLTTTKQSEILKSVTKADKVVLKEAPPEYEFIADPPSISAFDLDVVKLTAQFVARNGRQFLTNLMNREQRNFQFDFLRPQHSLFQYFTRLLEQYTKVLIPPKDLQNKLNFEADNRAHVLEQVSYRVAWLEHQEAARRKQEEALEKERVSYAQVDWHNFVVVETVDYQPWEVGNFPPPTNPSEVGARVLIQRRQEEHGSAAPQPVPHGQDSDSEEETGADTNVQDMEEGSSESEEDEPEPARTIKAPIMAAPPVAAPMPPISAPNPGNVTIKKYDPKAAAAMKKRVDDDQFLISPITGEKIPASQAAEHMKVGLLDPRWVEERDKHIAAKSNEEVVFAPGQSIESSLKHLAERRTDIFGVGEEAAQETGIGQKMGEEERQEISSKTTWDGHSSSAEAAARAARANVSLDDQIAQIHKQKGLLPEKRAPPPEPPKPMPMPMMPPIVRTQPTMVAPPVMMGLPVRPVMIAPTPVFTPMPLPPSRPAALPPMVPMGHAGPSMAPAYIPPPMQQRPNFPPMDEPPNKRQKTEENLIPEDIFMMRNLSPVTFKVLIPAMDDKPEWKMNGQLLTITLKLTDTVTTIKTRIMEELGMPQGKQKLQHENIFFKDANTLAYYNVTPGTMLQLQLKERGGRKK
jgi:splicing factor 3A subunit 1